MVDFHEKIMKNLDFSWKFGVLENHNSFFCLGTLPIFSACFANTLWMILIHFGDNRRCRCHYMDKNLQKMKNLDFCEKKIVIFHEIFNLQKNLPSSIGESWGWYFPGTWYYPKSCYLESFSSKALLFMKIELKNLKNWKKSPIWTSF